MRRWASRIATRHISWTDQPIRLWPDGPASPFLRMSMAASLEPFREVWLPDQGVAASLRRMRRIMARRTKAAALQT